MTPKRKAKSDPEFALPVTVGQTPPPRDHVAPSPRGKGWDGVRPGDVLAGITIGGEVGNVGAYLKLAAEHAGKCAAALECAIEKAQTDVALAIMIPVFAQLRLDAEKLQRTLEERRRA